MSIIKALFAGLVAVWVCIAQTNVTISGKVTDSSGVTPLFRATVRLEKGGLSATSGVDGSFQLSGATGTVNSQSNKPLSGKITASLHNGYMSLSLREKSYIEIAMYTIQGKELSSIHTTLAAGSQSVALPTIAAGVCFYRIKAGNEEFVLKSNSLTGVSKGAALSNQGTSPTALTRQVGRYAPFDDVIKVEKDGYLNRRVTVANSDTSGMVIQMILQDAGTVTDIDGNVYHAIRIGNQVWTAENLRTTKYNDGSAIPIVSDSAAWHMCTTPAYCYYNNTTNIDSIKKFGAIYNWFVVDTKKLAPSGWHVPTMEEWGALAVYLFVNGYNWDGSTTDNKIAKSLAAKTDWNIDTTPGVPGNDKTKNNRSGFSALPSGARSAFGHFYSIGYYTLWWSTTEFNASIVFSTYLGHFLDYLGCSHASKSCGLSVRLVRDSLTICPDK